MFHDLASPGESESVSRLESEQPRDYVLEAIPPDRLLRPFVIQCQDIVEHRLFTISLEWLDKNLSGNPFKKLWAVVRHTTV
jgi:hypothetical protein